MASDTEFVRGAERLSQRIATIQTKLSLPVLTNQIGDLLLRRTLTRFDQQVDPDERRWAPLDETTVATRRRMGFGGEAPILKRTGQLRASIKLIRGNNTGARFTNTGAGSRIGIQDPEMAQLARYMNDGTRTIPARRFLGIGALDVKAVDSFMRRQAQQLQGEI